jgi:hypothetical protein
VFFEVKNSLLYFVSLSCFGCSCCGIKNLRLEKIDLL